MAAGRQPQLQAALLPTIPLRRIGMPEDVVDVIVFLASHQGRWLTGQTLHVGGGITYRSDPAAEWEETVAKARGPLFAIGGREAPGG